MSGLIERLRAALHDPKSALGDTSVGSDASAWGQGWDVGWNEYRDALLNLFPELAQDAAPSAPLIPQSRAEELLNVEREEIALLLMDRCMNKVTGATLAGLVRARKTEASRG